MTWWFWVGWSVPLGLLFWRRTFRALLLEVVGCYENAEGFDLFMAGVMSCFLFWMVGPISVLMAIIGRCPGVRAEPVGVARFIGGETRGEKQKRRERELRDREARVRSLERELGIGQ